jgi:hypothetical protein
MEPLLILLIALGALTLVTLFWLGLNAAGKSTVWGIAVLLLSPISAVIYGISHWRDARKPFVAYSASLLSAIALGAYLVHASGSWQVMHTSLQMHRAVLSETYSDQEALAFARSSLSQLTPITPMERQQRRLQLMHDFVDWHESSFTKEDREAIDRAISRLMYSAAMTGEQEMRLAELQKRVASKPMPVVADADIDETAEEYTSSKDIFREESRRETSKPNHRLEYLPITAREARGYVGKMFMVTRRDGEEKQYKLIGTSPGALRFERRIPGGKYAFEYKYRDIERLRILAQVAQ